MGGTEEPKILNQTQIRHERARHLWHGLSFKEINGGDRQHLFLGQSQGTRLLGTRIAFSLAGSSLYALRGEVLTRVQFNRLVGAIKSQAVTTPEELFDVKDRMTAGSGMSFTPRKKPRFSPESSYEYVKADLLPTIGEAPSSPGGVQDHMTEHWSDMVNTIHILKDMSQKHSW
jgi:hypothetical protein